ncbi:HTH_38 domain-containing protein [Trichonephila clavipes]|nr:HTH_38 domain-containing protein [Trichonephila clavipes]
MFLTGVKEIRNLSDVSSWEHVPSERISPDILSRGCSAQQLVYLRRWEEPFWLSESPVQCPDQNKSPMKRREAGWSNRRIGRHLGRSDMVVARCWQQWITEGRVYRRGGSGRPRNTNDREDRAIRRVATSAPTTSLASIQRHLPHFQTSSAIKRNHKETTDRSWRGADVR